MSIPTKKWTAPSLVGDGRHTAEIILIEERVVTKGSENFNYLDIVCRITDIANGPELSYSVPNSDSISEMSKLGKLLIALGVNFQKDADVDVEKSLIGKKISIMVLNKPGKDPKKVWATIVEDSAKLL